MDRDIVKKIVIKYMEKLDRILPNANLKFHAKLKKVRGKVMYSFHVMLKIGKEFMSFKADDWDLRRTCHKVMKKVLNAAEKEFKVGGQKQQSFHPSRAKRGFGKYVRMKLKGLVKWR